MVIAAGKQSSQRGNDDDRLYCWYFDLRKKERVRRTRSFSVSNYLQLCEYINEPIRGQSVFRYFGTILYNSGKTPENC